LASSDSVYGSAGIADDVIPVPGSKPLSAGQQAQLIAANYEPASAPVQTQRKTAARYNDGEPQLDLLPVHRARTAPGDVVPIIRPGTTQVIQETTTTTAYAQPNVDAHIVEPNQPVGSASWAIQIGAFQSRAATDLALQAARDRLPQHMANVQPEIVPYRTAQAEWIFRARLRGFNQDDAASACRYFADCLTISPGAY
jgi:D-alanyl-D-alanine carboxypeptidase